MTDENTTDDTEQPSRDELENRVEQLEQTVQQMLPSRRDALKLGGTALAAGALGSAATGSASAGTNSVGTLGSASNPIDAELEDINPGSVRAVNYNNNEITGVSSLSTERLGISNLSVGSTETYLNADVGSADEVQQSVQYTDGVGTSADVILTRPGIERVAKCTVLVRSSSGDWVADEILAAFDSGGVTTIASQTRGTPPTTTYTANSDTIELTLGSGSANVVVQADLLGRTGP